MAQAVYTDPNAPSKRRAAQLQQQSTQRIADRTAARGTIADGLGNAGAARERLASARPVAPSTLSPDEVASFNRQSGGRFSQVNPTAGTPVGAGREAIDAIKTRNRATPPPAPRPTASASAGAPSIADDLVPSRAASVGERAGQVFRKAAGSKLARGTGALGGVLAVGNEVMDVANVAADKDMTGADIATQVAEGGGKLATAALGAKAGAVAGSFLGPVGTVLGGAAGGAAGYFGGEKLIEKGRELFGADPDSPAERIDSGVRAAPAAATTDADFSGVTSRATTASVADLDRNARQAANDGITPVADRTGAPGEVLGTFNGRPITRAQSDALAGPQPTAAAPTIAQGVTSDYRAPTGGGFTAGNPSGGAEERVKDLTRFDTPAGKLYAQLLADKTPTGKRMAMQFAGDYVNTGTVERGQNAGLESDAMGANASLMQGREQNAAGLERTRIESQDRGEYMVGEDGAINRISDGLMTPVTTADGRPAKAAPKGRAGGDSALANRKTLEDIITESVGSQADYAGTPEEYQAARKQKLDQLMTELGAGVNG